MKLITNTVTNYDNYDLGDIYYDNTTEEMFYYDGDRWLANTVVDKNYSIIDNMQFPYVVMKNKDWENDNIKEIKEWLRENKCGDYLDWCSTIRLIDKEHTVMFVLKFGG